jgi:hypothetical protein
MPMPPTKSTHQTMHEAYDNIVTRLDAEERARDARLAQDKGATWQETLANAYDRVHPEEAPPGGLPHSGGATDALSSTIMMAHGNDALLGGGAGDAPNVGSFAPKYSPAFTTAIGRDIEQSRDYQARRTNAAGKITAYGYFQMQDAALRDAKMKGDDGNWTGKWGVFSDEDFLANKNRAQDRSYDEFLSARERYNRARGNFVHVGKVNERRRADGLPMTVTEAGIMAAAHRMGQEWVKDYLAWADGGGWRTLDTPYPMTSRLSCQGRACTQADIKAKFDAVETWMRHFQDIPLRAE